MSLRALLYRRPSEPSIVQVVFDKAIYLVRLRRHRQARRYTLRIDAASREVVLTMPPRGSVKEAKEFAQKHGAWIAARLKRLPEAAPFAHGVEVPLRGVSHRIVHRRGAARHGVDGARRWRQPAAVRRRRAAPRRSPHQRLSQARGGARSRGGEPALCRRARRVDQAHLVRDQSSRWGSCSNTGVLSFSWRLVLAPSYVLDYLAAHEVAPRSSSITRRASGGWWSVSTRMSSAPRSGSTCTAPICTAMACPPPRAANDI